jgi:hypothetical protein
MKRLLLGCLLLAAAAWLARAEEKRPAMSDSDVRQLEYLLGVPHAEVLDARTRLQPGKVADDERTSTGVPTFYGGAPPKFVPAEK